MISRCFGWAVAFFSVIVGCTMMGSDYHVPGDAVVRIPPATASFMGTDHETSVSARPLPPHWWRLYKTPALAAWIDAALMHNTDLRVAQANLEKVQAQLQDARSQAQPTLALSAGLGYDHTSGIQALQPDHRSPDRFSYSAGATVSYVVDFLARSGAPKKRPKATCKPPRLRWMQRASQSLRRRPGPMPTPVVRACNSPRPSML